MPIVNRRMQLLVFEDAVGISDGYKGIWKSLLERSGLGEGSVRVVIRSAYRTFPKNKLLEWRKTRKSPGFNSSVGMQNQIRAWVRDAIAYHNADGVLCMDPSLLFLLNPDWNQCTLDRLRGGVYITMGIPWVVSLPVSAWHNKAKAKDIAKLNEGFVEKGDFEEYRESQEGEENDLDEDEEHSMEWHDPIVVPYGRIVLQFDMEKMSRLLSRKAQQELIRG